MDKINNFKTPYFVIDEVELEKNIYEFHKSLKRYWNNYIIGYSCKTNSLPWVLNFVKEKKCFAEVVSDYEMELAKLVGFNNDEIIFNGPNKGKEKFIEAVKNDVIINIDSWREINWLKNFNFNKEIRLGIRVNFDLENECPGETSFGKDGSRFGFSFENGDLERAINILNNINNVKVVGIHIHNTAKTRSVEIYKAISRQACKIADFFEYNLDYVDIGGGFFGGVPGKPTYDDYMSKISEELSKKYDKNITKLIVEPGSAIIGSSVKFICEVVDVKDTFSKRIVTINGSRHNVDPFMRKTTYFLEIQSKRDNILKEQVICGYTCLDIDRLVTLKDKNELQIGDKLIFNKVGAYTIALSPLFIEYFPDIYVNSPKGEYKLVRKAWSVNEYMQNSIL